MSKQIGTLPAPTMIRSIMPFTLTPVDVESGGGESMTVQNDSYTIKDILEKYTEGVDPMISKLGTWGEEDVDYDDPDLEKIRQYDLFETEQFKREHEAKVKDMITAARAAREKADQELAAKTTKKRIGTIRKTPQRKGGKSGKPGPPKTKESSEQEESEND